MIDYRDAEKDEELVGRISLLLTDCRDVQKDEEIGVGRRYGYRFF